MMAPRDPIEVVKPKFDFDPVDDEPAHTTNLNAEREAFKTKNSAAFESADYVPPDETKPLEPGTKHASRRKAREAAKKPPVERLKFRRRRGRPPGERKHSLSIKTTERHLAFLYGVAGHGELVGVVEAALEALAREVVEKGTYQNQPLDHDVLEQAGTLIST